MEFVKTYFYDFIPVKINITEEEQAAILSKYPPPVWAEGRNDFNIEEEVRGSDVNVQLLLNEYTVEKTKTDKQYLKMKFSNNIGVVNAKMWDNDGALERYLPLFEEHTLFQVSGRVEDYRGHKSITIHRIKPSEGDIDPFSLIACTKQNIEALTVELFSYLFELKSPFKEIALAAMDRFWDQFRIRPAAKGHHHNYLGGLLKHTVGLMRIARFIVKFEDNPFQAILKLIHRIEKAHKDELWSDLMSDNPGGNSRPFTWKDTIDHLYSIVFGMAKHKGQHPNYDLLMVSILFHDIGKLLEYHHAGKTFEDFKFLFPTADHSSVENRKATGITMDELGVMVGHIPYGVLLLTKIIETENIKISLEDIHHMHHCILCHHGLPEWGSCVKSPQTMEGYIIHFVDFLDSRYENTEKIK
ncbi:hydrolase [Calidifontibacillus erzurumensis]|uniref:Hydrolase n=1 Tax=Calidifontibacillus erzurumensis TaxID=2741433 RepID=A0A8J8GGK7_9BACI|nr:hydrolase [Calidifontibacillus erzurumensis]NSL51993.1 hydrolase [Calidifontibacillus erzurumensis]